MTIFRTFMDFWCHFCRQICTNLYNSAQNSPISLAKPTTKRGTLAQNVPRTDFTADSIFGIVNNYCNNKRNNHDHGCHHNKTNRAACDGRSCNRSAYTHFTQYQGIGTRLRLAVGNV